MKSISASIIVLAAAILVVGGWHIPIHAEPPVASLVGGLVLLIGLGVWFVSLKDK
jgi:hypothetical protein